MDVAALSPASAPRVSYDPVADAALVTIADQGNGVVVLATVAIVNAASVLHETAPCLNVEAIGPLARAAVGSGTPTVPVTLATTWPALNLHLPFLPV